MARIKLEDNIMDVFVKMADGNPGALTVMAEIYKNPQIDPDAAMGGLGTILMMDTLELYGSDIWLLYKDVCNESLPKMLGVLRSWQLGFITQTVLHQALNNPGILDIDSLYLQVKERLPNFGKEDIV